MISWPRLSRAPPAGIHRETGWCGWSGSVCSVDTPLTLNIKNYKYIFPASCISVHLFYRRTFRNPRKARRIEIKKLKREESWSSLFYSVAWQSKIVGKKIEEKNKANDTILPRDGNLLLRSEITSRLAFVKHYSSKTDIFIFEFYCLNSRWLFSTAFKNIFLVHKWFWGSSQLFLKFGNFLHLRFDIRSPPEAASVLRDDSASLQVLSVNPTHPRCAARK